MKIYLGSDHTGYKLKESVKESLIENGYEIVDEGAFSFDKDDDYPDFIKKVSEKVSNDEESYGIVFGGSGQGEAMVANRYANIRCAVFYGGVVANEAVDIEGRSSSDPLEIIKLSRLHNNANMLSISTRFTTEEETLSAIKTWLETPFSGDERHVRRISKF